MDQNVKNSYIQFETTHRDEFFSENFNQNEASKTASK